MYVEDVQKTTAFYERAFGIKTAFLHESGTYAEMETGQTRLGFVSLALAKESTEFEAVRRERPAPGIEVGFVTPEINQAYDRALGEGALAVLAPKMKPWGQWVSYVRDINGFLVEICTSVDPTLASD